jgi:hypothetical protein
MYEVIGIENPQILQELKEINRINKVFLSNDVFDTMCVENVRFDVLDDD